MVTSGGIPSKEIHFHTWNIQYVGLGRGMQYVRC